VQHTQLTKFADHQYMGRCPICAVEAEFREHLSFWMFLRAAAVFVAKPWNAVHTVAASHAVADNVSCDKCKTYVEVCPLCLAAWRGTLSTDGVECPGCGAQLC
jgi:hypothetical protein